MATIPSGDIQSKYQKLATEYTKLRTTLKVLKKGVLDGQARVAELTDLLKEKDKTLRKNEIEIDSLNFRNQQLTKRISVLQDDLEFLQSKKSKKDKQKNQLQDQHASASDVNLEKILQEELQKKILENARIASKLADTDFELSQARANIESMEKSYSESESKYNCEIAKLKNHNQELAFCLESNSKDKFRSCLVAANFANGDFLSEEESLLGSEDALSSVDESHLSEQLTQKTLMKYEQEIQKLKMEYEILKMENESLHLANQRANSTPDRRSNRADNFDGDFGEKPIWCSQEGVLSSFIGKLTVPFVVNDEILKREEFIKRYFRDEISGIIADRRNCESLANHYENECEALKIRLDEARQDKIATDQVLLSTQTTIANLEDELHSTSKNYEEQMIALTEHVGNLNDKLSQQFEEIQSLKLRLSRRK